MGITRGTTRAHIARAALEAIAFQSAELIEAMAADAGIALKELRVDGGATANDLLMQMQADLLGVPVVRPKVTETTALGAAYLAGLAVRVLEGRGRDRLALGARPRVRAARSRATRQRQRMARVETGRGALARLGAGVRLRARQVGFGAQERAPVVAQLLDRLVDVGERLVAPFLGDARQHVGPPAPRELLQRRDVHDAVVEVRVERRACSAP